jgi:hypothetical protein
LVVGPPRERDLRPDARGGMLPKGKPRARITVAVVVRDLGLAIPAARGKAYRPAVGVTAERVPGASRPRA